MSDQNQNQSLAPAKKGTANTAEADAFELIQRRARMLANSTLVPALYRAVKETKDFGKVVGTEPNPSAISNCVIALNIADRLNADTLMVMQNLYVVEGRPSWSSQFIIAAINQCGKFGSLQYDIVDLGAKTVEYSVTEWVDGKKKQRQVTTKIQNMSCTAWAIDKASGARIEGPPVTMEMAVQEGWYGKNGSKWQTMPLVMIRYRAATFFGRFNAPELLMGLPSADESEDIREERIARGRDITPKQQPRASSLFDDGPSTAHPVLGPQAYVSDPEPDGKSAAELFWDECSSRGLEALDVMAALQAASMTSGDYPADLTDAEADSALAGIDAIEAKLKGTSK